jgi:hypothetical protein
MQRFELKPCDALVSACIIFNKTILHFYIQLSFGSVSPLIAPIFHTNTSDMHPPIMGGGQSNRRL